jgi:hypothetical protein
MSAFFDAFFSSVETLATVGYGNIYPESFYGHLIVLVYSNASRFNGLDFSSEIGPKSFHQLAHPSDEVGSLHGFEQLRGKVVGLKMKDAIPTPAERLDIRRRQERVDPGINQLQIPEALNYDAQARVPIVHEVTAWAGEKFEGGEIRIL